MKKKTKLILGQQPDIFDEKLSATLCVLLRDKYVGDFGAGYGHYAEALANCEGYDIVPYNPKIKIADLSIPILLPTADGIVPLGGLPIFDWVICLEVMEHIHKQFEQVAIQNIIDHAKEGVIISWARPGQGGVGHVNEVRRKYVYHTFLNHGLKYNENWTVLLRKAAKMWWFKNNILVFNK